MSALIWFVLFLPPSLLRPLRVSFLCVHRHHVHSIEPRHRLTKIAFPTAQIHQGPHVQPASHPAHDVAECHHLEGLLD
jgi:hypothetical protein